MEKVLLRDGEITLHTRERSNKWQMYINIKGTDVFVRKSTGTSNLDDAAQIATNYIFSRRPNEGDNCSRKKILRREDKLE